MIINVSIEKWHFDAPDDEEVIEDEAVLQAKLALPSSVTLMMEIESEADVDDFIRDTVYNAYGFLPEKFSWIEEK